jgi:hypothetical protein
MLFSYAVSDTLKIPNTTYSVDQYIPRCNSKRPTTARAKASANKKARKHGL